MRAQLLLSACVVGALAGAGALSTACGSDGPKGGPADAGPEASDDAADEAAASTCEQGACSSPEDCARSGTVAACWQCFLGCCFPVPQKNDPAKACDAGSACFVATCDGAGACTKPSPARDGTPCGTTCGGVFVFGQSTCKSGACVGDPQTQKACTDRCYGDYTDCPECAAGGCVASCDPLPTPDRCFP